MKLRGKYICQDGEILKTQEGLPIEISLQELFVQLTTDEILELGRKLKKKPTKPKRNKELVEFNKLLSGFCKNARSK